MTLLTMWAFQGLMGVSLLITATNGATQTISGSGPPVISLADIQKAGGNDVKTCPSGFTKTVGTSCEVTDVGKFNSWAQGKNIGIKLEASTSSFQGSSSSTSQQMKQPAECGSETLLPTSYFI
ncbi:uncharacterized protein LOC135488607 [Lineus longissimus]|uniref:uncharacterized protein LOC135488607 n=1 Tax=Lineus longissimus TaxID=88925 RepID=UPI00315CF032